MGLSLGRRSETKRCAGCQRRGKPLTLLGNGTSYCPSCADRVRKLLGFGVAEAQEVTTLDEVADGVPIVALGFEPAAEVPATVSAAPVAAPEPIEVESSVALADGLGRTDETAIEPELEPAPIAEPWAASALHESDANGESNEKTAELLDAQTEDGSTADTTKLPTEVDATTQDEPAAVLRWQQDEGREMAQYESSPFNEAGAHKVALEGAEPPAYTPGSFGPVDPSGDPAADALVAPTDSNEGAGSPAPYEPPASHAGSQHDGERDEPRESMMVAMASAEDTPPPSDGEERDEPAESDAASGGLGWALHEEQRRLVARRTDIERRIEEAKSELEAIERRVKLIDALLDEESAAA